MHKICAGQWCFKAKRPGLKIAQGLCEQRGAKMNKLTLTLIGLVAILSTGCVTTRQAYVNNGVQVHEARCNGNARSMADCFARASQVCNGNFEQVNQEGRQVVAPMGNSFIATTHRSLLFTCKE